MDDGHLLHGVLHWTGLWKVVVLKHTFGREALGSKTALTESSRLAGEAVAVRPSSVGGGGSRHG